jgi:CRISPR system Cascade subunit CasA
MATVFLKFTMSNLSRYVLSFFLLKERWLPVRRHSGVIERLRPAEIFADASADPIVAAAWGRADFDAATLEFLIGLLAVACPPDDEEHWAQWHDVPPPLEMLDAAFAPFAQAFALDGDGPRFGQDLDSLDGQEEIPVAALLIEQPGANTVKENKDLFQKRGQVPALSRAAAAMALFTLQTYAPSGGAGHRTSLRGGGPLTTLLCPPAGEQGPPVSLWQVCWLNTPAQDPDAAPPVDALSRVFPWLAPAITSDGKPPRQVTPHGSHPLQAFWGQPRRIRLRFSPNAERVACAITGMVDERIVRSYVTRNYGVMYDAFRHPLSPYYKARKDDVDALPVHPQPGGLRYRDWPDVVMGARDTRMPASVVPEGIRRLQGLVGGRSRARPRLLAAGYDMDNMKARGFLETTMPVFVLPEHRLVSLGALAGGLVDGAGLVASLLATGVRNALQGENAAGDTTVLTALRERFFTETEDAFYRILGEVETGLAALPADGDANAVVAAACSDWRAALAATARRLFDEAAPVEAVAETHVERTLKARGLLLAALMGHGRSGEALFKALQLAAPEKKPKAAARGVAAQRKETPR